MAASQYDIGIIGAGPIGITTACAIQLLHPNARICVIDKRPEFTRNHGLNVRKDSVLEIQEILQKVFNEQPERSRPVQEFIASWSGNFVRTSDIEKKLGKIAKDLGITVLRDESYAITEERLESILEHNEGHSPLNAHFEGVKVIIGADGAHSPTRKYICRKMGVSEFSEQETLRYLVELKYQSPGDTKPRGLMAASSEAITHGQLTFETMSANAVPSTKPVTLHDFVDKETYDALRIEDCEGNLKGVFGNSWTLEELRSLSKDDRKIEALTRQLDDYVADVKTRNGDCIDEKISTLIMEIYKSQKAIATINRTHVLLVGDAESGIVLEGGFNKGLRGAAACVVAVVNYLSREDCAKGEMPDEFNEYEARLNSIFYEEKNWAKAKNYALRSVETSLASSHYSSKACSSSSESCVIL